MRKGLVCLAVSAAILLVLPPLVRAQDHGSGGGGGCGDVFGDLIHIKRDDVTGQPILQKRWVELPKDVPGYGWGYCVIPVDEYGEELAFAPLSCDVDENHLERVVEVDYFGRLNGGRTKERNNRMHFNEVISSINAAGFVRPGPAGRLELGYQCEASVGEGTQCTEWAAVDSPMESMGLYTRLMKYGHLQTDPFEVDEWHHGDPSLPTQYHPALGPEDYPKFHSSLWHMLPGGSSEAGPSPLCFPGGGTDSFDDTCAGPERLDSSDFNRAASFLGGAANKTGRVTVDLVQYFNRVMKIPKPTNHTEAPVDILPALVRDCGVDPPDPPNTEPTYPDILEDCPVVDAGSGLENSQYFPDVQEEFVDFLAASYVRSEWRDESLAVIKPLSHVTWKVDPAVSLLGWLGFANPGGGSGTAIHGFVRAASDALRAIEFIHNHAIPDDLGWDFTEKKVENKKE